MSDRRRVNGPAAATQSPCYLEDLENLSIRTRDMNDVRAMYLKTGVTPSASGSAFLEVTGGQTGGVKLTCTVHGPRSLPRSAPFSPHMMLNTHVKYAPFATKQRRGYLRDASERDLSLHLETALRGALIAHRWPKSGVEVIVTIIEGEQGRTMALESGSGAWDCMNILSGCITVAAAAMSDAGIDCVDVVSGGVAALVEDSSRKEHIIVLDPVASEHTRILAACCVGYLPARDEITNLWMKGEFPTPDVDLQRMLIGRAVHASIATSRVLDKCIEDNLDRDG